MIPVSKVINAHPNIANFFTEEWFKLELKKNKEDVHPLAKHLTSYANDGAFSAFSSVYLGHVEICLKTLKDDIKGYEKHFEELTCKDRYYSTLAQLEIGLMCKNMGLEIKFEPPIQEGKFSDIKITNAEEEIFIEVSIREGPPIVREEAVGSHTKIVCTESRTPLNFKKKIARKSLQLSNSHPGILALVIDPSSIMEIEIIKLAFGFSRLWGMLVEPGIDPGEFVKKRVSSLLIYCNYTAENEESNCFNRKEDSYLFVNPLAEFQLPTSVIRKFETYGTEIIIPELLTLY